MRVVSRHPPLFRTAENPRHYCGAYQLRAVVHAYGKDALVSELFHSPGHFRRDWSLPWQMPGILGRYGIRSTLGFWRRGAFANNLAGALEADQPIVFLINSIRGNGTWHWISAWGHDPEASEFLCYDSQAPTAAGVHRGNTRYHADLLTKQLPFAGTFAITVEGENAH